MVSTEYCSGLIQKPEILKPQTPTLFLLGGVSGAGLTTAYKTILAKGYGINPAPQFMSRPFRPDEVRGVDDYSVSRDVLQKIPQQIAVSHTLYDTEYGYFIPAIRQIKKALQNHNVIIDNVGTQADWRNLLGSDQNMTSLFFAPNHPTLAVNRIVSRAEKTGVRITPAWVQRRVDDGRRRIVETIRDYDYLIDTSELSDVVPQLESAILMHSCGSGSIEHILSPTSQSGVVERLIERYSVNLQPYIESIL